MHEKTLKSLDPLIACVLLLAAPLAWLAGLLLRREGLYSSHLAAWRRWRRRARPEYPQSKKPPTESQLRHEIARLRRENTRLQLKLEHADKLLALQKKLADMMEAIEPAGENEGSSA